MTELSKLIGFSLLLLASSAQAERAVMERSTMSAGSFIIFPDNTKQYTAGISSGQVTGDNLGNHTATQTLDLDFNNIANANRIGVGNVIVDYSGSVIEYTRTPTFPLDVLGNSAIQQGSQIYAKELVSLSSSSTLSPYIVETSVDCSGTGVCGVSNAAGIASENGSYWGFYGGAGDSVILSIRYVGFSVPNGSSVIGAEGYIKKYSNNPTALTGTICKMFYPTASTEIGINQCESNDWSLTASTSVYGNSGYSWGVALATTQVNSDDFGWGLHISLSGNATAYIDVVKMRLFYASDPIFKAGYSDQSLTLDYNGEASLYVSTYSSVGIMKQPAPPYELDVNGDINFSGSLYQNGVEFVGGGGGGDNLGSHIATQTLVMGGYSIQSSSSIRANEFFGSGSGLTGVITSTAVIVSDLDSLESIVATMGASTASLAGYIDSVVNNDIPRIDAALSTAVYTTNSYANPSWITSLSTSKIDLSTVTAAIASAGGGGGNSWVEQNFYAQTNGTQAQFTLSQTPTANSLTLSKNGVVLVSPADYSLSSQLITMVTAPASSTTLVANYAVTRATDIAAIRIDGGPIGSIIQHSTTTPPSGYLYCDGSSVSTTTYSDLFAVTGYRYGGTGANFSLPDFRGMFARGAFGNLNSRDPDGNRVVGSTQTDTLQGHWHDIKNVAWSNNAKGTNGVAPPAAGSGGYTSYSFTDLEVNEAYRFMAVDTFPDGTNGTVRVSTETRPENIAVAFHIKYAHTGTASIQLATTSVILATNNTFTGPQTFTGSVTVSSFTVLNGGIKGVLSSSRTIITATYTSATAGFTTCAAGSTVTITTNGGAVLVGANGWWKNSTINEFCVASYLVDGVNVLGGPGIIATKQEVADIYQSFSFIFPTLPLAAGSHSFCLSFRLQGGGSCANLVDSAYSANTFWAMELK